MRAVCVALFLLGCGCSANPKAASPAPAETAPTYESETETESGAIRTWRLADDDARLAFELSYELRADEVVPGSIRINLWAEALARHAGGAIHIRLSSTTAAERQLEATVKDGIAAATLGAGDLAYVSNGLSAVACEELTLEFAAKERTSLGAFSRRLAAAPTARTGPPLKQCKKGCLCGNSCISCSKTCHK